MNTIASFKLMRNQSFYLGRLGAVLAIKKFWKGSSFNRVNRVVIKPSCVAWNNDMVRLVCYVIVMLYTKKTNN